MKTYKIYATKNTPENLVAISSKYNYYRANSKYILVYTDKKKPKESVIVPCSELNEEERAWIQTSNIQITMEVFRNEPEAEERMIQFISSLRKELEAEKAKILEETDG